MMSDIVPRFIDSLSRALASLIGQEAIEKIFLRSFNREEVSYDPSGTVNIQKNIRDRRTISAKIIALFIEHIVQNFGYDFSEQLLESIYRTLAMQYRDRPEDVFELLDVIPERSLEKERLKNLSRQELERRVLERTKALEETNAHLEQLVVERTKALAAANEELGRKNEQLIKLSEAKTEFVSIVAHQMQTPLTVVKWALDELYALPATKTVGSDEAKRRFSGIVMSTDQLIRLVDNLLNLARIEEGRLIYTFDRVSFTRIVMETVRSLEAKAQIRGIILRFTPPPLAYMVRGDAEKLSIAIGNIVDNAIKYTSGGKEVAIGFVPRDNEIILRVQDAGAGIPADAKPHIFEKFFRAQNARESGVYGTGLGLYIVKEIIEGHGGTIAFESQTGKGTTFTVTLPLIA